MLNRIQWALACDDEANHYLHLTPSFFHRTLLVLKAIFN